MARKLRLEKGDLVLLKTSWGNGFILGRVDEVYQNEKENWSKWGVYGYTIYWQGDDIASNSGWGISDITTNRLKYIKDPKVINTLYGQSRKSY